MAEPVGGISVEIGASLTELNKGIAEAEKLVRNMAKDFEQRFGSHAMGTKKAEALLAQLGQAAKRSGEIAKNASSMTKKQLDDELKSLKALVDGYRAMPKKALSIEPQKLAQLEQHIKGVVEQLEKATLMLRAVDKAVDDVSTKTAPKAAKKTTETKTATTEKVTTDKNKVVTEKEQEATQLAAISAKLQQRIEASVQASAAAAQKANQQMVASKKMAADAIEVIENNTTKKAQAALQSHAQQVSKHLRAVNQHYNDAHAAIARGDKEAAEKAMAAARVSAEAAKAAADKRLVEEERINKQLSAQAERSAKEIADKKAKAEKEAQLKVESRQKADESTQVIATNVETTRLAYQQANAAVEQAVAIRKQLDNEVTQQAEQNARRYLATVEAQYNKATKAFTQAEAQKENYVKKTYQALESASNAAANAAIKNTERVVKATQKGLAELEKFTQQQSQTKFNEFLSSDEIPTPIREARKGSAEESGAAIKEVLDSRDKQLADSQAADASVNSILEYVAQLEASYADAKVAAELTAEARKKFDNEVTQNAEVAASKYLSTIKGNLDKILDVWQQAENQKANYSKKTFTSLEADAKRFADASIKEAGRAEGAFNKASKALAEHFAERAQVDINQVLTEKIDTPIRPNIETSAKQSAEVFKQDFELEEQAAAALEELDRRRAQSADAANEHIRISLKQLKKDYESVAESGVTNTQHLYNVLTGVSKIPTFHESAESGKFFVSVLGTIDAGVQDTIQQIKRTKDAQEQLNQKVAEWAIEVQKVRQYNKTAPLFDEPLRPEPKKPVLADLISSEDLAPSKSQQFIAANIASLNELEKQQLEQAAATRVSIQAQEEHRAVAERARFAINPYSKQISHLQAEILKLKAAHDAGELSLEEYNKAVALGNLQLNSAVRQAKAFDKSLHTATDVSRLAGHQLTNLTYQVNDVIQGFALGQPPMQIFAQQGFQIYQILSSHPKGFAEGVKAAVTELKRIPPVFGLIGGLVTVTALITASILDFESQMRKANTVLTGVGKGAGITTTEFREMAEGISRSSNMSVRSIMTMQRALATAGIRGAENISNISSIVEDFGATVGLKSKEAQQQLVDIFKDPASGAEKLRSEYRLVDAATVAVVKRMVEMGNTQEAINTLHEATKQNLLEQEATVGSLAAGWARIEKFVFNVWYGIGKTGSGAEGLKKNVDEYRRALAVLEKSAATAKHPLAALRGSVKTAVKIDGVVKIVSEEDIEQIKAFITEYEKALGIDKERTELAEKRAGFEAKAARGAVSIESNPLVQERKRFIELQQSLTNIPKQRVSLLEDVFTAKTPADFSAAVSALKDSDIAAISAAGAFNSYKDSITKARDAQLLQLDAIRETNPYLKTLIQEQQKLNDLSGQYIPDAERYAAAVLEQKIALASLLAPHAEEIAKTKEEIKVRDAASLTLGDYSKTLEEHNRQMQYEMELIPLLMALEGARRAGRQADIASIKEQIEAKRESNQLDEESLLRQRTATFARNTGDSLKDYARGVETDINARILEMRGLRFEATLYRKEQELINEAIRRGIPVNNDLLAWAEKMGVAYANVSEQARKFEERQAGISEAAQTFADIWNDAFDSLVFGGERFVDVLNGIAQQIAKASWQAFWTGDGPLAGMYGTKSETPGRPGGVLGSFFGRKATDLADAGREDAYLDQKVDIDLTQFETSIDGASVALDQNLRTATVSSATELASSVTAEQTKRTATASTTQALLGLQRAAQQAAAALARINASGGEGDALSEGTDILGGIIKSENISTPDGFRGVLTTPTVSRPVPGRARGGPVQGSQSYVVGEKGPELFVPSVSGKIVTSGASQEMAYGVVALNEKSLTVAQIMDKIVLSGEEVAAMFERQAAAANQEQKGGGIGKAFLNIGLSLLGSALTGAFNKGGLKPSTSNGGIGYGGFYTGPSSSAPSGVNVVLPKSHGGGIVGSAMQTATVSSAVLANAPRFHTGYNLDKGVSGLKQDEIPTILQIGEKVVPKDKVSSEEKLVRLLREKLKKAEKGERISTYDGFSGYLTGRARGGPVEGGKPYVVGERGPEIMVPGASGKVVSSAALQESAYGVTALNEKSLDTSLVMAKMSESGEKAAMAFERMAAAQKSSSGGGGVLKAILGIAVNVAGAALGGGGGFGSVGAGGKIAGTGLRIPKIHGGGTVGTAGPTVSVSPEIFSNAPRLHTGYNLGKGVSGLKPDEFPAVLQYGEKVIPRSRVAREEMMVQAIDKSLRESRNDNRTTVIKPSININLPKGADPRDFRQGADRLAVKTSKYLSRQQKRIG